LQLAAWTKQSTKKAPFGWGVGCRGRCRRQVDSARRGFNIIVRADSITITVHTRLRCRTHHRDIWDGLRSCVCLRAKRKKPRKPFQHRRGLFGFVPHLLSGLSPRVAAPLTRVHGSAHHEGPVLLLALDEIPRALAVDPATLRVAQRGGGVPGRDRAAGRLLNRPGDSLCRGRLA
jgi:hypothetical protein